MNYVENNRLSRMLVRASLVAMVFVSLLIAPLAMAAAALIEQRLGPSAGGWLVALPVSFAVAVFAVTLDTGAATASTMALSAAAHVPAQLLFAAAFASVLTDRGLLVGGAVGALAYVTCAVALAPLPDVVSILAAIPLLALAPRLMPAGRPRLGSARSRASTAMICAAASLLVGVAILTTRLAGPVAAGAIAAFPSLSTTLLIAVAIHDGRAAGAQVLVGLSRSLPCYLTFCLVIAVATPSVGLPAIALALLACAAAGRVTWQAVPLAPRAVTAG
jgi:hypothetical protein